MRAVILAAGRGIRMGTYTDTTPKPLLRVHGVPLLERTIRALPDTINEVCIVVGYLKEKIQETIGTLCAGKKITYVVMDALTGTASALWLCQSYITDATLVLMGDDLYGANDIAYAAQHQWYMGVSTSKEPFVTGKIAVADGLLQEVCTVGGEIGDYQNTGLYVVGPALFAYDMVQLPNGEFGLPQTIAMLARDIPVHVGEVKTWIRITEPKDLVIAEQFLENADTI